MNEELSKKDLLEVKASVIKTYLQMLESGHIATVIDDLETELEVTEKQIADIKVLEKIEEAELVSEK